MRDHEPVDLSWPEDRPDLLPFLPLVYVAWSDGVLTASELEALALRMEAQLWLDQYARREIRAWLRPGHPPTPGALARVRERLGALGARIPEDQLSSLADLGLALARDAGAADGPWSLPEARAGLDAIEEALGVIGREAARNLVGGAGPVAEAEAPSGAPSLELERLRHFLDQPHTGVRRRVMELLADPDLLLPREMERAPYRERVMAAVRRLADEGLGGLAYPREFGGGGSPGQSLAAFETLAFGDLSVLIKFGVQFGLFGGSVHQLGTRRHHERYLRSIASLDIPGCYAMTETGHGSNVRDIETTARYDESAGEFVIHTPREAARKDYIGNAALHGRMATVFAQLQVAGQAHGVHAFLVPIRDGQGGLAPGVRVEDCGPKEGLNGVDNGRIWFDRVRVPRDNLLDRFGRVSSDGVYESPIVSPGRRFYTMLGTLVAGRISIAAASISASKSGLTIAVRHSARRRQFGPEGHAERPLLDHLAHQRLLLVPLARSYALHFAVRDLARRYEACQEMEDAAPERRAVDVMAAGLKAVASAHCVLTLQACREACGGAGYLGENRLGSLKADTDVFTTFEGANTVLLQLVAKGLLTQLRDEMGDLNLWGMIRLVAERAQSRVTSLNPVQTRRTDEEHLRSPDFHLDAFRYREERLLASLARRLKSLVDEGMDSFDALNQCQDHAVALGEAHVERVALASFHDAVMSAPSPGLAEDLGALEGLYALHALRRDGAWYLESGYLDPPKSRAIRRVINRLCGEVRERAGLLVDAFDIPDEVLAAPTGRSVP